MRIRTLSAFALLGAIFSTGAQAQSEAEFVAAFSGEWRIHDEAFAQGVQICRITLTGKSEAGRYTLDKQTCGGDMASVTGWGISEGQMALFASDQVVVTLGGTQRRMTGTTKSGNPIVLDRVGAAGTAEQLQAARQAAGCYFLGYTDRCAAESDAAKPAPGTSDQPSRINVIVNLNARAEARDDAAVIGVVPTNSCVTTSACVTASDGVWCRAQFGEQTGWLRKLTIRQNRWPIVTFVNKCQQ